MFGRKSSCSSSSPLLPKRDIRIPNARTTRERGNDFSRSPGFADGETLHSQVARSMPAVLLKCQSLSKRFLQFDSRARLPVTHVLASFTIPSMRPVCGWAQSTIILVSLLISLLFHPQRHWRTHFNRDDTIFSKNTLHIMNNSRLSQSTININDCSSVKTCRVAETRARYSPQLLFPSGSASVFSFV